MDKINKLLKELINVSLINEADIRILRRVVILAIFNSDIPNQMERDFKRRISSNPDPGVIKSNKKFLEQLLEDKEALVNDEKYLELKQDQKFQELSNSVNNKLTSLNKANDINFGNIAFTKPQLSKKFSYSTLLYYAAEGEVNTDEKMDENNEHDLGRFKFQNVLKSMVARLELYDGLAPIQEYGRH